MWKEELEKCVKEKNYLEQKIEKSKIFFYSIFYFLLIHLELLVKD